MYHLKHSYFFPLNLVCALGLPGHRVGKALEKENPDTAVAFDFEWINAKRVAQLTDGKEAHRQVVNKWTDVRAWVCLLQRWKRTDWSLVRLGSSASGTRPAARPRLSMIRNKRRICWRRSKFGKKSVCLAKAQQSRRRQSGSRLRRSSVHSEFPPSGPPSTIPWRTGRRFSNVGNNRSTFKLVQRICVTRFVEQQLATHGIGDHEE